MNGTLGLLYFLEDCNVISVDWRDLAGPVPWYGICCANAKKVGKRTGVLLLFMMDNVGLSASDVHVIGFSLGGQLVAFIGQQTNGALARITGLDPAGKHKFWHKINQKHVNMNSLWGKY